MDKNPNGPRKFPGGLAAALVGLAVAAATVAAPSTAEAGLRWRSPAGGWSGGGPYRGKPVGRYRVPSGRRYQGGGYAPRGHLPASPGHYAPPPRLYVPPARVYYGPPGGYYPPMI